MFPVVLTVLLPPFLQGRNGAVLLSRGIPGMEAPAIQALVYLLQLRRAELQGRPTW